MTEGKLIGRSCGVHEMFRLADEEHTINDKTVRTDVYVLFCDGVEVGRHPAIQPKFWRAYPAGMWSVLMRQHNECGYAPVKSFKRPSVGHRP